MNLNLLRSLLSAVLLGSAQFSMAQPVAEGLPLEMASAGVTQAEWEAVRTEVKLQSRRAQVSEQALLAAAEATGARFAASGRFNALSLQQAVFEALKDQADQLADLQARLDSLINDTDPAIADLFNQAREALNAGHLLKADRILADVATRDLAGMQRADADVERLRTRAGETMASRAEVAFLQADYLLSAEHFGRAAEIVPQSDLFARAQYFSEQARALSLRGRTFSEAPRIREAVIIVEGSELPLRESMKDPLVVLATRLNLGVYLANLGELGDEAAATAAIEILSDIDLPSNSSILDRGFLSLWRGAQNNLGSAYRARATDAESLFLAEQAYRRALKDADLSSRPWDVVTDNLASTLAMQAGAQADIVPKEAFELFEHALNVRRIDCCAYSRAQTLVNLASAESINGESASDVSLLQSSLGHYSEALAILSPSSDPRFWATAQRGVGLTYDAMGELGDLESYGKAASAYKNALAVMNLESSPKEWIELQILQGRSLRKSTVYDALDASTRVLNLALASINRSESPELWALAKYELGMAYLTYSDNGGTEGIDSAISALQEASQAYSEADIPLQFALSNQNLGVAYERKGNRSNPTYFPLAADSYRRSLTIYSKQNQPEKWALAQASLGNVLRNMGERSGDKSELQKASEAYQRALEIYSKEATARKWGDAWNNLGSTYVVMGDRKSLDSAVKAYSLALEVRTREKFPDDWSSTQLNLGAAHMARFEAGKKRAINEAIVAFENGLSTRSRSADPAAWARANYNLALGLGIYSERVDRDRLADAISAAQDAVSGFRDAGDRMMTSEAEGLLYDLNLLHDR